MKVFGWAADQEGCGFYRLDLPLTELGKHGHDTQVSVILTGHHIGADVIVGQRVCNPGPSQRWQEWGALPRGKRPALVYEVDDDLLGVHESNDLAYGFFQNPEIRENIRANAAVADLVTVSTEPLAKIMRELNPNVAVLPNYVPASIFTLPWGGRNALDLVIGWAGSATHRLDFAEVEPQLRRHYSRNSGHLEYHVIGANYFSGPIREKVRHTEWTQGVTDYYAKVDFDIGLAPLAPLAFNHSKSHIKALEYAALGIPCIASDFGPYSEFVYHGETGYLVRQPHEWIRSMRILEDPRIRHSFGVNARRVARLHTIEGNWSQWLRAYEGII